MNRTFLRSALAAGIAALVGGPILAQVDTERRTTILLQSSSSVSNGEEWPAGFGYFLYNRDHLPWEHTTFRLIYAGVYADGQLSWFAGGNPNTALGIGIGGGAYLDGVDPYQNGERLSHQRFYGDSINVRAFVNQTIPNPSPLPINLRLTYTESGTSFRNAPETSQFVRPADFRTQQVMAEVRIGGIEPGVNSTRGAEMYLEADANERTGLRAFGPIGAPFPVHPRSNRLFGSLGGRIPIGRTLVVVETYGGVGRHLDELDAWKLGGNMVDIDPFSYTIHGYYTRELLADRFALANLEAAFPIVAARGLTGHLYGDYAVMNQLEPATGESLGWHRFRGIGAGLGFRAAWGAEGLLSYGYGFDAIRDGGRGGHEIGLIFEKRF